jgi:predicted small secreted protein
LDKRIVLGIGIGLTIASILMLAFPKPKISEAEILKMARDRGMIYKDEVKSIYE